MPKEQSPGKPTGRRYRPEEKAGAVRMVRTLRAELGTEHGTVQRLPASSGMAPSRCGRGCVRPISATAVHPGCRLLSRSGSRILSKRSENLSGPMRF
jgi:hypothetical protein